MPLTVALTAYISGVERGVRNPSEMVFERLAKGGYSFQRGTLYHLLANRIYHGELCHKG